MAKNYSAIYNNTSDSNAIEQRFFIKAEAVNGTFNAPLNTDFLFTLPGGSITAAQPLIDDPQRTGDRQSVGSIAEKRDENWSLELYFNVDLLAANGNAAIDNAVKTLWRSSLGRTSVGVSSEFIADGVLAPSITMTIMQVLGDTSLQMIGAYVQDFEIQLPGDGQAKATFSGKGGQVKTVGIGKSTVNNTANTLTVQSGEGWRFPVGSKIMIIMDDGLTLSGDTAAGTFRTVTSVTGDVLTVDGAVLTDADGSGVGAPIYVVYYEPLAPVAINDPQTGLVGEISSSLLPSGYCFRNLTISGANNHEEVNYCFGSDGLDAPFFIPGGKLTLTVSADLNLSKALVGFYNKIVAKVPVDILAVLGAGTGRRYEFELPKIDFSIPEISVPESGSIPVTFQGMAKQTSAGALDALVVTVQ